MIYTDCGRSLEVAAAGMKRPLSYFRAGTWQSGEVAAALLRIIRVRAILAFASSKRPPLGIICVRAILAFVPSTRHHASG